MDMGDAPIDTVREGLAHVRGILPASDDRGRCWLGRFLWWGRSERDEFACARICYGAGERP